MNDQKYLKQKKYKGFSLPELMITIVLGLFITAGVFTVFVSSKRLSSDVSASAEQFENGTFALDMLSRDLKKSYFFAGENGNIPTSWSGQPTITASDDCVDTLGVGSFPTSAVTNFHTLWASSVSSASGTNMSCLTANPETGTNLITDSDYIAIKRARGSQLTGTGETNHFYLDVDLTGISVAAGAAAAAGAWEYMHHVYYLDEESGIQRLRRISLQIDSGAGKMVREAVLAEGIEKMEFMFALDQPYPIDRDYMVHSWERGENISPLYWQTNRVLGVKIFLLMRAANVTPGYDNTETYQLGETAITANDHFKRKVFSRVLMFNNSLR